MRILFVGDSLSQTTGLSYVAASVARRFVKDYGAKNVAHATIAGSDSTTDGIKKHGLDFYNDLKDIKLYNCQLMDGKKCSDFNRAVEDFRPEVVFTIHDPWMLDQVAFSGYRGSYFWVAYTTIEVPRYPATVQHATPIIQNKRKSIKEMLESADLVIPCTDMGKNALTEMGISDNVSNNIYSGLDFDQRCTESVSRKEIFGGRVKDNDFVFMTMGVNSERKKLDRVIESFAAFLDSRNDAKRYFLYVHTDFDAQLGGTDLTELVTYHGIGEQVLAQKQRAGEGISRGELYRLYAACDCYIGLPSGEGFGYGIAEAMMHKKPTIYSNYGGHAEIGKVAGLPVAVNDFYNARAAYMRWALADVKDAAKAMSRMVSDPRLRESLAAKGEEFARRELDWTVIYAKMKDTIEQRYNKISPYRTYGLTIKKVV